MDYHTIFHSRYMFGLGNSLQEYFKSSLVLAKNESEQTSLWYGISTISMLRWSCTNSLLNTTYSFSTFFMKICFTTLNFEKRLFKLDPSLEVRNFQIEISFNFSLSLFYCGFQYRPLPSIQLTGFHFCYQHQLILIPLDPGLMRSL